MKAAFITVLSLVAYFLFFTLFPVQNNSLPVELPTLVPTVVLGASVEKAAVQFEAQPTIEIPATLAPTAVAANPEIPTAIPTTQSVVVEALPTEQEGVPVSSANLAEPVVVSQVPVLPVEVAVYEDPQLVDFAASLINGQADQVVGVYVPGVLALPVMQQPSGQASFVSVENDIVTQFSVPSSYGAIGLLAHNYLSGNLFFGLAETQDVIVIHGDGRQETYRVSKVQRFQALSPTSVYSDFVDLSDPAQPVISATELFHRVYTTPNQLVFQTCIEANGDPSWGRLFVTAELVS